ncbi:MAG: DNA polymerase/3'-5' exonuclease PolX [Candidatus Nanoarchaeia archaeon]|nr:DNA polymerase/3'-5' exonuclease PolX [Candidatus Nanoarchaeia archaeon]MDD5239463.1 DNA polymerase/3'-5' exonuclease PolX [Candidatus Nanoarchaeia archaeon]
MAVNQEIAAILYRISEMLEIKNIKWEPIAYSKAARTIESLSENLEDVYRRGGTKALMEIPGVGKTIASHIEEFIRTGKIKKYDELKKSTPIDIESLSNVEGLGPKKIMLLYKKLKIKNLGDLEQAAMEGKIQKLPGMRKKTEENILKAIQFTQASGERKLIGYALPLAREIIALLQKQSYILRAEIAGSIARRKETIGDIDILVTTSNPKKVMNLFTSLPKVKRVIAKGETKSTVVYEDMQVDCRVLPPGEFGSALQYFIGSKDHNVAVRRIAISKGYKLSEYGLFRGTKRIAGKTEDEIYSKLGMQTPPPEIRENRGEVEAALKHELPQLVELKDIKGDLHMHTNYSDAENTVEEMVRTCKARGYSYCAITDHVSPVGIANGLTMAKLKRQQKEIDAARKKLNFPILHGAEVDIKMDGELFADAAMLSEFDIVLASIHQGMQHTKEEMTKRMIKAMENRYVNIICHPTGRKINKRPGYELDFEKVFTAAKANNIFLESNAAPIRLDLSDVNTRAAKDAGLQIPIGTDAHAVNQLDLMEYGVSTARRAWCTKKDILNTLSLNELLKRIKR